jgi:hypothetical protein
VLVAALVAGALEALLLFDCSPLFGAGGVAWAAP